MRGVQFHEEVSDTEMDWKRFVKPKLSQTERKKQMTANCWETMENESFEGALPELSEGKRKLIEEAESLSCRERKKWPNWRLKKRTKFCSTLNLRTMQDPNFA